MVNLDKLPSVKITQSSSFLLVLDYNLLNAMVGNMSVIKSNAVLQAQNAICVPEIFGLNAIIGFYCLDMDIPLESRATLTKKLRVIRVYVKPLYLLEHCRIRKFQPLLGSPDELRERISDCDTARMRSVF